MDGLRRSGAHFAPGIRRRHKPHTVPSTLKSRRCLLSGAKKKASPVRDERERLAREKAESDAVAARNELARERALIAQQLLEDRKNETAAIGGSPPETLVSTETLPTPSDEKAAAKRTRDANARVARKRRAAKDAAQNWPFSAW